MIKTNTVEDFLKEQRLILAVEGVTVGLGPGSPLVNHQEGGVIINNHAERKNVIYLNFTSITSITGISN